VRYLTPARTQGRVQQLQAQNADLLAQLHAAQDKGSALEGVLRSHSHASPPPSTPRRVSQAGSDAAPARLSGGASPSEARVNALLTENAQLRETTAALRAQVRCFCVAARLCSRADLTARARVQVAQCEAALANAEIGAAELRADKDRLLGMVSRLEVDKSRLQSAASRPDYVLTPGTASSRHTASAHSTPGCGAHGIRAAAT